MEVEDVEQKIPLVMTPLSDFEIDDYVMPTLTPQCLSNCVSCCLLLLGWITPTQAEEMTQQCIVNRSGSSTVEIVQLFRSLHPIYYGREIHYNVTKATLSRILETLEPRFAMVLMYGTPMTCHVAVIRKLSDGTPELIDPQRGSKVDVRYTPIGMVTLKDDYYSVKGYQAIQDTIVRQSLLFGYYATQSEANASIEYSCITYEVADDILINE
jgi:hypothetical protein